MGTHAGRDWINHQATASDFFCFFFFFLFLFLLPFRTVVFVVVLILNFRRLGPERIGQRRSRLFPLDGGCVSLVSSFAGVRVRVLRGGRSPAGGA